MNVDLDARAAVNETTTGQALSTVVRLYQLKEAKTFAQLEYAQLQNHDLELLKTDLVATKDVVMRPGSNASVSEPMDKEAEYVGVVAFFRAPSSDGVWKLLIPKKQWKDTDPVKVHVQGNLLAYDGAKPAPVKREAPQQSTTQKTQPGMPANSAVNVVPNARSATVAPVAPAAALGDSADSPLVIGASMSAQTQQAVSPSMGSAPSNVSNASAVNKAAAKNVSTAVDSLNSAKSSANSLSKNAAGLISR